MSEQKLIKELESLRAEIDHIDDNSANAKERLNVLIDEIEASIAEDEQGENHTLLQNMKDAVAHFETEHPRATAILNEIMVSLSNMGI